MQIHSSLEASLSRLGFSRLTEIQERAFPAILSGRDVLLRSPTGTGKTAAFLLPLLQRILSGWDKRVLVAVPSRELAIQGANECRRLAGDSGVGVVAAYGGTDPKRQEELVKGGAKIIVGTASRLRELVDSGLVSPQSVGGMVLDEADRLFSKQFLGDVTHLCAQVSKSRQTILCCVQMPAQVLKLALEKRVLKEDYARVDAGAVSPLVTHVLVVSEEKEKTLGKLLRKHSEKSIVFCNTTLSAEKFASALRYFGMHSLTLHSGLKSAQRHSAIKGFAAGRERILVATDLAARGIQFEGVKHVYSAELPSNDFYLHRAGRTGRMGASGECVSIAAPEERALVMRIYKALGIKPEIGSA